MRYGLMAVLGLGVGLLMAGATGASAQRGIFCASEGGFCQVPYPTTVFYGAPGRGYASLNVGPGGVPCTNGAFGDPARGAHKQCSYLPRGGGRYDDDRGGRGYGGLGGYGGSRGYDGYDDRPRGGYRSSWRTCAGEGGFCSFEGRRLVRYGAGGRYVERMVTNGVPCNNRAFGDPAVGAQKHCQVSERW